MTKVLLIVAVIIGAAILQFYLSSGRDKLPGFILPAICVIFSIVNLLNVPLNSNQSLAEQIASAEHTAENPATEKQEHNNEQTAFNVITTIILYNIPTVILLVIYLFCKTRNSKKHNKKKTTLGFR